VSGIAENRRVGETKLKYDDVEVGAEAPALTHELTRTDLVMYAGASGDFNPMHHDEVAAQGAGLPSVFGHGMFSMGLLGKAITDYVGIGNLERYKVRFTRQTWPGEMLISSVKVTGKREEDGEKLVELEVTLSNQDGEVKVAGEAVATAA
jgi:acyl dehydratase